MNQSIYEELIAAMPKEEIDHCNSDLYVKSTPISESIIKKHRLRNGLNYEYFTDQITKTRWIDIYFAYTPYWNERSKKKQ